MLLNRSRANDVMEREQPDGLVAQLPINVYDLSGYRGLFNTAGGYDAACFSVLSRDDAEPVRPVVPALEIRRVETRMRRWASLRPLRKRRSASPQDLR